MLWKRPNSQTGDLGAQASMFFFWWEQTKRRQQVRQPVTTRHLQHRCEIILKASTQRCDFLMVRQKTIPGADAFASEVAGMVSAEELPFLRGTFGVLLIATIKYFV